MEGKEGGGGERGEEGGERGEEGGRRRREGGGRREEEDRMSILGNEASKVINVPLVQQLHCFCLAMKSYVQDSQVIPALPRNRRYTSKVISIHVYVHP